MLQQLDSCYLVILPYIIRFSLVKILSHLTVTKIVLCLTVFCTCPLQPVVCLILTCCALKGVVGHITGNGELTSHANFSCVLNLKTNAYLSLGFDTNTNTTMRLYNTFSWVHIHRRSSTSTLYVTVRLLRRRRKRRRPE